MTQTPRVHLHVFGKRSTLQALFRAIYTSRSSESSLSTRYTSESRTTNTLNPVRVSPPPITPRLSAHVTNPLRTTRMGGVRPIHRVIEAVYGGPVLPERLQHSLRLVPPAPVPLLVVHIRPRLPPERHVLCAPPAPAHDMR